MCRSWLSFVGYHSKHDFIFIVLECYSDLLHLCATRDQSEKLHDIPHYNSVLKIYAILILFSLTCGSLRSLPWTSYTGLKTPFISFFSSKIILWMDEGHLVTAGWWLGRRGSVKVLSRLKRGSWLLQSEQVRRGSESEGEREPARWKLTVFCKLISEVTFHHFHHILFVRSKLLNQVNTQQKAIT